MCQFWTCYAQRTAPYIHVDYAGIQTEIQMCFQHRAILARAKTMDDMDINLSPEGWLWIDTFGWHLKHGDVQYR